MATSTSADKGINTVVSKGFDSHNIRSNRNVWILMRRAHYNDDFTEKHGRLKDFKIPQEFSKANFVPGVEVDTRERAMQKHETSTVIGYKYEIDFEFKHYEGDSFAEEIISIINNLEVGMGANAELLVIYALKDAKWDDVNRTLGGTGFIAKRFFGALTLASGHLASGDDTKLTTHQIKFMPSADPINVVIEDDGSITELVKCFAKLLHPISQGIWDNRTADKVVPGATITEVKV